MRKVHTKLYIIVFFITIFIFSGAFYISSYINERKTQELKATEDKIAIDILSFETQFDIVKESSCKEFDRSNLRTELNSLASKLKFMENQLGENNPEVFRLKRYYSLLEIRDYLLTKRMSEQCKLNNVFILYFYSQGEKCNTCITQNYILQAIRDEYPEIEVYSFDYEIDLPAVQTLITLHNIPKAPPIIDINGKIYGAFENIEDIRKVIDPIITKATTTATSTKKSLQ